MKADGENEGTPTTIARALVPCSTDICGSFSSFRGFWVMWGMDNIKQNTYVVCSRPFYWCRPSVYIMLAQGRTAELQKEWLEIESKNTLETYLNFRMSSAFYSGPPTSVIAFSCLNLRRIELTFQSMMIAYLNMLLVAVLKSGERLFDWSWAGCLASEFCDWPLYLCLWWFELDVQLFCPTGDYSTANWPCY